MLSPKECAEAWKTVIRVYDDTISENKPDLTMEKILDELGVEKTKEIFATVAALKKHDGRIYGKNREAMNAIPVNVECVEWTRSNPVIYADLDHIHTSHINNLITQLRKKM